MADSRAEQANLVIEQFKGRFGRTPACVAAAPGRVNLIGEHTDYSGGFAMPFAIDRHALIAIDLAAGDRSQFVLTDLNQDIAVNLREPVHRHTNRAVNYLLGVIAKFIERGDPIPNIDLLLTSTVPIGAGLSSSAAVEVAVATALSHLLEIDLSPLEMAHICQEAEHQFAGTPCGIMDMYTATHAINEHALLLDCRDIASQPIRLPQPDDIAIVVADTGVRHELAGGEYADRRAACEAAASMMNIPSLRSATLAMLEEHELPPEYRRRASHVITENTRTLLAARALIDGEYDTLGDLLFASHESLRSLYEVSCPELDFIVNTLQELRHQLPEQIIGGRMTGGGFGGCVVVLMRADACSEVMEDLAAQFAARFDQPLQWFTTPAVGAASIVAEGNDGILL